MDIDLHPRRIYTPTRSSDLHMVYDIDNSWSRHTTLSPEAIPDLLEHYCLAVGTVFKCDLDGFYSVVTADDLGHLHLSRMNVLEVQHFLPDHLKGRV